MNTVGALSVAAATVMCGAVVRGVCSLRSGFFGRAITSGDEASGAVALTFDDGPDVAATPVLLDLLAEIDIKAAFFVVGRRVDAAPALARRIVTDGHLICNHAMRHAWFTNFLSTSALVAELRACNEAVARATGVLPTLYRPPFGIASPATFAAARALGLTVVGWTARGRDLRGTPPEISAVRVLRQLRSGGVALLHDGERDPIRVTAATRLVVDGVRAQGLRWERLDAVLGLEGVATTVFRHDASPRRR